jgi:hypothetical protein
MLKMNQTENQQWNGLLKIGAVCAGAIVLIYLLELVVVVIHGLPPSTAAEWFALFQRDRLVGIIQSFALDIIAVACHIPFYAALFILLRQTRQAYATLILAVLFAFIGTAVYFATNTTFSLLFLSDQFASAATDAQKTQLLTSGQTLLAIYNGTGPFVAFLLLAIAGILVSIGMLHSPWFTKPIAIAGIVGNALELGLPASIDPPLLLQIDPILIGIGGVILLYWYAAIAVKCTKASILKPDSLPASV